MKDGLGSAAVVRMAASLACADSGFPQEAFIADAMDGIEALELKERVRHIIGVLHSYLPADFTAAADLLTRLKAHWIPGDPGDNLGGFAAWPIIDYIGEHGLEHPETALAALRELTALFSAEFAIRPFFIHHPALTHRTVHSWCTDPDEHVRRLVSEGSRPRLPWGQQLPAFIKDPAPIFPLLEPLKNDSSDYVRRSVANNLNDISKDHSGTVIALCRRWQKNATPEVEWIIRHATRSLVKAGHPEVFGLLGYTENPDLTLQSIDLLPNRIRLGETVEFSATVQSNRVERQRVVIDYAVHHMKANGQTSPKVFKLRTLEIGPGETITLTKRHAIKAITTRKYYPGEHAVEILINGKSFGRAPFLLNC